MKNVREQLAKGDIRAKQTLVNETFGKIQTSYRVHAMTTYIGMEVQFQAFLSSPHTYVLNHVF